MTHENVCYCKNLYNLLYNFLNRLLHYIFQISSFTLSTSIQLIAHKFGIGITLNIKTKNNLRTISYK